MPQFHQGLFKNLGDDIDQRKGAGQHHCDIPYNEHSVLNRVHTGNQRQRGKLLDDGRSQTDGNDNDNNPSKNLESLNHTVWNSPQPQGNQNGEDDNGD